MAIDFRDWTKEDFEAFDARRNEIFAPTQEEIDNQKKDYQQEMFIHAQTALKKYNIHIKGDEQNFEELYTLYIKGNGTVTNEAMYEWLGDEEEIDRILSDKITNANNLESFIAFVNQYEM